MPELAKCEASIVIPVGNVVRYLAEAVESVVADCPDIVEIIVVDDGNQELVVSEALGALSERVTILRQDPRGAGAARNAGVNASRGEILMFLDADDLWLPGRYLAQVESLRLEPEMISCGRIEEFLDVATDWEAGSTPHVRVLEGPSVITTACLRTVFDRVGPFRDDLEAAEYIEWSLRAQRLGIVSVVHPPVWARRRVHAGNRDRTSRSGSADYLRVIREHRTSMSEMNQAST